MERVAARKRRARKHHEPFVQKPHSVICHDQRKLSRSARCLYDIYKMVCGEGREGRCWMNRETLGLKAGMSPNTVTRARRELEQAGLITVYRKRWHDGGYRMVVRCTNVWAGKDVSQVSANGVLKEPHESCRTPVHDGEVCTAGCTAGTNVASGPAQNLCPNNNTSINNQVLPTSTSCSSLSSNVEEYQHTIGRHRSASGERDPSGSNPSGGGTKGETMHNRFKQPHQPQGSGMRGFDINDEGLPPKEPTYDEKAAERLVEAVSKKIRLLRRPRVDVWAKDFEKFRRQNGVSESDFEERLAWYIEHINDDFMPIVHSAKGFCEKIDQIGVAQLRASNTPATYRNSANVEAQIQRLKEKGLV